MSSQDSERVSQSEGGSEWGAVASAHVASFENSGALSFYRKRFMGQ